MRRGIYENPFPALTVTAEDKVRLYDTAEGLVKDACAVYEDFMRNQGNYLSSAQWRRICQREDVVVYHDRRLGAGTDNKDMHMLLTVGTTVGTVDDALYAVLSRTTDDMRVRSAYVGDRVTSGAVFETIVDSTPEDPFHSVSLRWSAHHVRLLSKPRAALYVEALGKATILDSVPVGYRLMHSVSFPSAPPIRAYERFNMSVCMLWRQVSANKVQIFVTSFVEIRESLFSLHVVKSVAHLLLMPWKYVQVAQLKKLTWMLKHKELFLADDHRASIMNDRCSVCGSLGRSTKLVASSSCAICSRSTCKLCCIKMNLMVLAPDATLRPHPTCFCVRCVAIMNTLDSAAIAGEEAYTRRQQLEGSLLRSTLSLSVAKSFVTRLTSYVRNPDPQENPLLST